MNCPKCHKEFERRHHRQKYCDECRGVKEPKHYQAVLTKPTMDDLRNGDSHLSYEKVEVPVIDISNPVELTSEGMVVGSTIYKKIEDYDIQAHKELGPLDVYSPERWSKLQGNYEFEPALGRARCKEMSSNIALPSPGDPAYSDTPSGDEMLTFNDLPTGDRFTIERESNDGDPERTREVLIECALKYHKIFGNAHAHEFKR